MAILDARENSPFHGAPTFSLANRALRGVWAVTWLLLASWTPPPLHRWRRFLLVLFGAKVAKSAHIYGSARIWLPSNVSIGAATAIGPRAILYSMAPISVGDFVQISQGAHLCAGTHDVGDINFQLIARPIHVADRAWIAAEAFVGAGVTVGEGAVLGARGCTMRDLESWTIYAGNPARLVKARVLHNAGEGEAAQGAARAQA